MSVEPFSFPHFFKAEELGKSLREVAVDFIPLSQENVTSRWFHGTHDVDLYIWLDSRNNVIKQQITFYGQVVEWNAVEGIKTGLIIEEESESQGRRPGGSEIIQFDQNAQSAPIAQALELCRHIGALNEEDRSVLLTNFSSSPTNSGLSSEQFIARFGAFLERPKARRRGSPWGRWFHQVWNWFKS
jgi:hypothetical protein